MVILSSKSMQALEPILEQPFEVTSNMSLFSLNVQLLDHTQHDLARFWDLIWIGAF